MPLRGWLKPGVKALCHDEALKSLVLSGRIRAAITTGLFSEAFETSRGSGAIIVFITTYSLPVTFTMVQAFRIGEGFYSHLEPQDVQGKLRVGWRLPPRLWCTYFIGSPASNRLVLAVLAVLVELMCS